MGLGDLIKKTGKALKESIDKVAKAHRERILEIRRRKEILSSLSFQKLKQVARNYGIPTKKEELETTWTKDGWPQTKAKLRDYGYHELLDLLARDLTEEQFEAVARKLPSYYPRVGKEAQTEHTPIQERQAQTLLKEEPSQIRDSAVRAVVDVIASYNPQKYAKKEETYEEALRQRIEGRLGLPDGAIVRQYSFGASKIDLCWPEKQIAIEIKQNPNASEIQRLMGQIHMYSKRGFVLIIAIFNLQIPRLINELKDFLKEFNYPVVLIVDGKVEFENL